MLICVFRWLYLFENFLTIQSVAQFLHCSFNVLYCYLFTRERSWSLGCLKENHMPRCQIHQVANRNWREKVSICLKALRWMSHQQPVIWPHAHLHEGAPWALLPVAFVAVKDYGKKTCRLCFVQSSCCDLLARYIMVSRIPLHILFCRLAGLWLSLPYACL